MSFVQQSLGPGEKIVYQAQVHWIGFLSPGLLFVLALGLAGVRGTSVFVGLLALAAFGAGIVMLVPVLIHRWTTELAVTSRKVVGKWGFISRDSIEQRLEKVDSVEIQQSIWGRLLDFGSVFVHGSGVTDTPVRMIAAPLAFRHKVNEAIELSRLELIQSGSNKVERAP